MTAVAPAGAPFVDRGLARCFTLEVREDNFDGTIEKDDTLFCSYAEYADVGQLAWAALRVGGYVTGRLVLEDGERLLRIADDVVFQLEDMPLGRVVALARKPRGVPTDEEAEPEAEL